MISLRVTLFMVATIALLSIASLTLAQRSEPDTADAEPTTTTAPRDGAANDPDEAAEKVGGAGGVQAYREAVISGNIFSRQRGRRAVASRPGPEPREREEEVDPEPATPPDPADNFAFRGVSYVGQTPRAFFEDRRTGSIHILTVDDTLADRRIVAIELDTAEVAFERGNGEAVDDPEAADQPRPREPYRIELGFTLSGEDARSAPAATPSRQTSRDGDASDDPDSETDDGELSIEERMRLRRQQQLNQ
ncbi:MAG: hypothetical protein WD294_16255 [Phycisphaeraceae bacterium]